MKYFGRLFGESGRRKFDTGYTGRDWDDMCLALSKIAEQPLALEMDDHSAEHADWLEGYDLFIGIAREALKAQKERSENE